MPEELNPDSMRDSSLRDPSTLAAFQEAGALVGKEVRDVNGTDLGKVTRCFAEEGTLTRCEVTLSSAARGIYRTEERTAGIPADWIARVEGEEVRLSHAAEEVLSPNDPRPPHASDDLRGADNMPRKNR